MKLTIPPQLENRQHLEMFAIALQVMSELSVLRRHLVDH